MSLDLASLQLTPLDTKVHSREAFVCGESSLDNYLRKQAGQDSSRNAARTYVLANPAAVHEIIGYFTLSTLSVRLDSVPEGERKGLARYPDVSALLIGRLAVAEAHQGTGAGGELLRQALILCAKFGNEAAAALVVVDALHNRAAKFYDKYGFAPFDDSTSYPKRLYIPMSNVQKALKP